jgi:hypothetical protein
MRRVFSLVFLAGMSIEAADCNVNGVEDAEDILGGVSDDCNGDGVPDECEFAAVEFGATSLGEAVSLSPRVVLSVDLDGDGADDLVVGSQAGNRDSTLAVFLSRPGRVFEKLEFDAGTRLTSLTAADVDGDGNVDIVSANSTVLRIFKGDGTGALSLFDEIPVSRLTRFVRAAEVTGDEAVDLIAINNSTDLVHILANDASGNFNEVVVFSGGERPVDAVAGDFDGDGARDLVVAYRDSDRLSFHRNLGGARFAPGVPYELIERPDAIDEGDLDGDGDIDLLVTNLFQEPSLLLNAGDGTFTQSPLPDLSTEVGALADVTGDGVVDVLLGDAVDATLWVLSNDGNGRLGLEGVHAQNFTILATGDFDSDGGTDLAFARDDVGSVEVVWSGVRARVLLSVTQRLDFMARPHGAALGDVNGDGLIDVVGGTGPDGQLGVVLNQGDGTLSERTVFAANVGRIEDVALADLDGDGHLDMVGAAPAHALLAVFLGQGDGLFAEPVHYEVGDTPRWVVAADLDGDGFPELLDTSGPTNTVTLLRNAGDGTFPERLDLPVGGGPRGIAISDLDGDGDLDAAVANSRSATLSLLLNEQGDFALPARSVPVPGTADFVCAADFDGDGTPDLAVADSDVRQVLVLLNRGDMSFTEVTFVPLEDSPRYVTSFDVDGDGHLDLLTANLPRSISVVPGRGDGTFVLASRFGTGDAPRLALPVDMNRDGNLDVVSADHNEREFRVFINEIRQQPDDRDFLELICTPRDFERVSADLGDAAERSTLYTTPVSDDPELLPSVFQNSQVHADHRTFLESIFPGRFAALSTEEYADLVLRRATRRYFTGAVSRLRLPERGVVFGFDVLTDPGAQEQLSQAELEQVFDQLQDVFALRPLVYAPRTMAAREVAEGFVAPAFEVVLIDTEPSGPPPVGTPTFELEIPPGLEVCATFQMAGVNRGPRDEYDLKSRIRLRSGTHLLETVDDTSQIDLIEELLVQAGVAGGGQEVAEARSEGILRLQRLPVLPFSRGLWRFRFTYEQDFVVPSSGEIVRVKLVNGLDFDAVGDRPIVASKRLDEEFFVRLVGTEALEASLDGVSLIRYGACDYPTLDRFEIRATLEDGVSLVLEERWLEPERLIDTGPAALVEAAVSTGETQRRVTDYWNLVYSAFRHNDPITYWVVLDPPLDMAGLDNDVHAIELAAPGLRRPVAEAAYLGADFQVLRTLVVTSFDRTLVDRAPVRDFRRGDAGADGKLDVADAIRVLHHVFRGDALPCRKAADSDDNGRVNLLDAITLVFQLFRDSQPRAPFPGCGQDATADTLTCEEYPSCP